MDKERLIANYVLNKLSDNEKIEFERLMETDADFKEQVAFETKLKRSLFVSEHQKLKGQLQNIERTNSPKNRNTGWYWIAASIVVLLSIGAFWTFSSPSNDALFERYYQVASNTSYPIVRSNDTAPDVMTKAYIAYESQDYQNAQTLFSEAYNETSASELLFYNGMSQLESGNLSDAIETLKKHQTFKDTLLEKSQWYLVLAYLKSDNLAEAKTLLNSITANASSYRYAEAKELLSEL